MHVRPLSPACGAEVTGIDLRRLGEAEFQALRRAWLEADGVLVVRGQELTPEEHVAFSRRFGELERFEGAAVARYRLPGVPEIYRVSNKVVNGEPAGREDAGTYWHSDASWQEKPLSASLLHALEIPPYGGDTLFANMYLAYESLSEGMKELLEGLVALHESHVPDQGYGADPEDYVDVSHEHPVVRTHPETGRKLLFVNRTYTTRFRNMTADESRPLLDWLFQHCVKAEHVLRLTWAPGSLAFWDNRCTQHLPMNDYHGHRREMHRVAVLDEPPAA